MTVIHRMSRLTIALSVSLAMLLANANTALAQQGDPASDQMVRAQDEDIRSRTRNVRADRRIVFVAVNPQDATDDVLIDARLFCRTPQGAMTRVTMRTLEPGERLRVAFRTPRRGSGCSASITATSDDASQTRLTIRQKPVKRK